MSDNESVEPEREDTTESKVLVVNSCQSGDDPDDGASDDEPM